ncbi:hypothetical protein [Lacticaseibacillus sharpeae]|uniref:Uncharacterized protein n=1 Tax=Lacticaseibacillus sharpeae JCM 1186 = DSM 20505 TaxID=1291052 RepID=A0A0R1ZMC1_9LACO|nr:hypothetical protein [Lacticaseibacillus sharpeae]KRM56216.1 hypothetical protein FC18_GL000193 [Lacticaseibacillus sharpeae JCM 1186 = DSM 20505]
MHRAPAKHTNKGIVIATIIVALIFIGIDFYLTKPTSMVDRMSTVSFGIILTLGLIILTVLDGRARSKFVRFLSDWLWGTVLLAFVHLYMIGLDPEWLFLGAGSGIIAFLAMIAALRTKFITTETDYDRVREER